jgi:tetratricopeptide (TPR) repeat protein
VERTQYQNMRILAPILFAVLLLMNPRPMKAQQISPSTPPPPPPAEAPPISPSTPPPPPSVEAPPAPAEPVFDPLHAEKSIEVGTFYLKKGNYDAAIDRFMDATRFQPKLAKPWRLLGESYEKKHDSSSAIESYKKYLEVFPGAEDAAKVKKRVSMLEEKTMEQASKHPSR